MIKGSPTDPNADFLRGGQQEILQAAIDAGDITIVGEAYTDGWLPANAQRNMEQILTAQRQHGRRRGRLQRRHRRWRGRSADRAGHGRHPGLRSGRRPCRTEPRRQGHPDRVGLERRARARQGRRRSRRGDGRWRQPRRRRARPVFTTPGGVDVNAIFLAPVPITQDNLSGRRRCAAGSRSRPCARASRTARHPATDLRDV